MSAHAFTFTAVSHRVVLNAIKLLKSLATSTHDKISLRLLKLSASAVATLLANLFNLSIATSAFSTAWKLLQVTPIHKKENRQDLSNYRPISLLPLWSILSIRNFMITLRTHVCCIQLNMAFVKKSLALLRSWLFQIACLQSKTLDLLQP